MAIILCHTTFFAMLDFNTDTFYSLSVTRINYYKQNSSALSTVKQLVSKSKLDIE